MVCQKDAKFTWPVPAGATRVRLLVGKIPLAIPTVVYSPAISEREVTNFEDGIWYFNAQLRNAGGWGEVAHFKLQIDTQPPKPFAIKFIDGVKTENPKPTVVFDTTDALSGLDYYKIKIGENDFLSLSPEIVKSNSYTLPPQEPGKRSILVQALIRLEIMRLRLKNLKFCRLARRESPNIPKKCETKNFWLFAVQPTPTVK